MVPDGFRIVDGSTFTDRAEANRAYMALINEAFGFNASGEDFRRLLPKLFGPGRDGARHTTFTVDTSDGSLAACAGRFPVDFIAGNTRIKTFGIGNVGVRAELRKRGLMSAVMPAAVNKMISDGAVFSFLGGSRHRYKHFGFERAGIVYSFDLSAKTLRKLGEEVPDGYTLTPLSPADETAARFIAETDNRPWRAVREPREMYDILTSWHAVPYVLYKNGEPCGWAVVKGGRCVTEAVTCVKEHMLPLLGLLGGLDAPLTFKAAEYETELYDTLWPLSEGWHSCADNLVCVLNYRELISELLKVKAGYRSLADGCLRVVIEGIARTERLMIEVNKGIPEVHGIDAGAETDNALKLSHADATALFFTHNSPASRLLEAAPASWFPLPLYIGSPNDV